MITILKKLLNFPTVSGNESCLSSWLKSQTEAKADKVCIDKVGNLVVIKGEPKITIMVHMDKVGYMVFRKDDNRVGLVPLKKGKAIPPDKETWPVSILGEKVISADLTATDSGLVAVVNNKNLPLIKVGNLVTISPNLAINNGQIISQGLDNCLGLLTALTILTEVKNIHLIFTVQEEINQLGAKSVAKSIETDSVVVLDTTYDTEIIKMGGGPSICLKDDIIFDKKLANELIQVAKINNIPYQLEVLESGGSDARAIKEANASIDVAFMGIPIKSMHTPKEVASLNDVKVTADLLINFINKK